MEWVWITLPALRGVELRWLPSQPTPQCTSRRPSARACRVPRGTMGLSRDSAPPMTAMLERLLLLKAKLPCAPAAGGCSASAGRRRQLLRDPGPGAGSPWKQPALFLNHDLLEGGVPWGLCPCSALVPPWVAQAGSRPRSSQRPEGGTPQLELRPLFARGGLQAPAEVPSRGRACAHATGLDDQRQISQHSLSACRRCPERMQALCPPDHAQRPSASPPPPLVNAIFIVVTGHRILSHAAVAVHMLAPLTRDPLPCWQPSLSGPRASTLTSAR